MVLPIELKLDPLTLLFAIAWMALLMGAVAFSLARGALRERVGLHEWGAAMLACGTTLLLYTVRGQVPAGLSFVLANGLLLLVPASTLAAYNRLLQRPIPWRGMALLSVLGFAGVPAAHWGGLPKQVPAFTLSAALATQIGYCVFTLVRHHPRRGAPSVWISAALMGAMALALGLRALSMLAGADVDSSPTAQHRTQMLALLTGALFINGASLGFFFMVQDRQRGEAVDRARRDLLTGLYTRAGFYELAERMDRPGADPARYAIVIVDIDHFKAVNDTFGHLGGDLTLAHAARLVANTARITDLTCRYGGEEFCVLLRDCSARDAAGFAQRLVREAATQTVRLRDGRSTRYTLSAGWACRGDWGGAADESLESVIDRADQALYQAKRSGRNRALPEWPAAEQPTGLRPVHLQRSAVSL